MKMLTAAALLALALTAGCATVGTDFADSKLPQLQPGTTTLAQATELLGAQPKQTVRHDNGSVTYIWQYVSASAVGVSTNKSASLIFGADGKLVRVGQLVNVPLADSDRERLRVVGSSRI